MEKIENSYRSIIERKEFLETLPNSLPVFHEASRSQLESIDKEGLKPLSEQSSNGTRGGSVRIHQDEVIDSIRPNFLKEKGISRFNIFAYPNNPEDTKSYFSDNSDMVLLKCLVDVDDSYVFDMQEYTSASSQLVREKNEIKNGNTDEENIDWDERTKVWFEDYWKHFVSLKEFHEYYEYSSEDKIYIKKDKAPEVLPESFCEPEVLIPNTINQKHIILESRAD